MIQNYMIDEREVHFSLDDVDRVWRADSSIPKYIRLLHKAGWKQTASEKNSKGVEIYASFEAPAHAISIRKAKRQKRVMTDEQRAAAAERLRLARNSLKVSEKSEQ